MNNTLVKLVLMGLVLMMVTAPFAGLAPVMLILWGLGVCSIAWSLVEAFFTADVKEDSEEARFESSRGKS